MCVCASVCVCVCVCLSVVASWSRWVRRRRWGLSVVCLSVVCVCASSLWCVFVCSVRSVDVSYTGFSCSVRRVYPVDLVFAGVVSVRPAAGVCVSECASGLAGRLRRWGLLVCGCVNPMSCVLGEFWESIHLSNNLCMELISLPNC